MTAPTRAMIHAANIVVGIGLFSHVNEVGA